MPANNTLDRHDIDPGKQQRNVLIASFNGSFRDDPLNEDLFDSLDGTRRKLPCGDTTSTTSDHSSLGNKTLHWHVLRGRI